MTCRFLVCLLCFCNALLAYRLAYTYTKDSVPPSCTPVYRMANLCAR